MRHEAVTWALALMLPFTGLLAAASPASALPDDRPAIVSDIERRFEGFFMFTTDGGGDYTVYQRVDDGLGLSGGAPVVCMLRECFLEIAHASERTLQGLGEGRTSAETVRRRFRAVRDAYREMRSAGRGTAGTADAWHAAIAQAGACMEKPDAC